MAEDRLAPGTCTNIDLVLIESAYRAWWDACGVFGQYPQGKSGIRDAFFAGARWALTVASASEPCKEPDHV